MRREYFWRLYCLLGIIFGFTSKKNQTSTAPFLESSQVELLCSEQGVVKYRFYTDKALRYENGDCAYPEGFYIEFYDSDDQDKFVTGSANSVYFFAEKNIYEFKGDVELKNLREMKQLNTEELYWSPDHKIIYTDTFVRIETKEESLTAEGLTAKQDLSYYAIFKPQGLLNVK